MVFHFDEKAVKLFHLLDTLAVLLQLIRVALLLLFRFLLLMQGRLLRCVDLIYGVGVDVIVYAGCIELLQPVTDFLFLGELEEVLKSVPLLVTLIDDLGVLGVLFHAFMNIVVLFQHLAKVLLLVGPKLTVCIMSVLGPSLGNIVTRLNFGRFRGQERFATITLAIDRGHQNILLRLEEVGHLVLRLADVHLVLIELLVVLTLNGSMLAQGLVVLKVRLGHLFRILVVSLQILLVVIVHLLRVNGLLLPQMIGLGIDVLGKSGGDRCRLLLPTQARRQVENIVRISLGVLARNALVEFGACRFLVVGF